MMGFTGQHTYAICPGCDAWQVQVDGPLTMAAIDALEEELGHHARECVTLLRLQGATYLAALEALGGRPRPAIEGALS